METLPFLDSGVSAGEFFTFLLFELERLIMFSETIYPFKDIPVSLFWLFASAFLFEFTFALFAPVLDDDITEEEAREVWDNSPDDYYW